MALEDDIFCEDGINDKGSMKEEVLVSNNLEIFEPCFVGITISIPRSIETFLKNVDKILFVYEIVHDKHILVIDQESKTCIKRVYTENFGTFDFSLCLKDLQTDLVFIFGAEKFKQEQAAEIKKRYKEAVKNRDLTEIPDLYAEKRRKFIEYQIENKVNFVFIESSEFFHRQLKSLVDIIRKNDIYVPKTKKFTVNDKYGYLKNLLMSVPGVSQSIAVCILDRFPNLESLIVGLSNKEEFCRLVINEGNGTRKMPVKVFDRLVKAFFSENQCELL